MQNEKCLALAFLLKLFRIIRLTFSGFITGLFYNNLPGVTYNIFARALYIYYTNRRT